VRSGGFLANHSNWYSQLHCGSGYLSWSDIPGRTLCFLLFDFSAGIVYLTGILVWHFPCAGVDLPGFFLARRLDKPFRLRSRLVAMRCLSTSSRFPSS
jgi:hypothetical protein